MMTDKPVLSQQEKRDFCALMISRYGLRIDENNELLPVFYFNYQAAVLSEKTVQQTRDGIIQLMKDYAADIFKSREALAIQTKEAITEIKDIISEFRKEATQNMAEFRKDSADNVAKLETKQYRFDNPETAFYFALGKYGVLACVISVLLFIGFLVIYLGR